MGKVIDLFKGILRRKPDKGTIYLFCMRCDETCEHPLLKEVPKVFMEGPWVVTIEFCPRCALHSPHTTNKEGLHIVERDNDPVPRDV